MANTGAAASTSVIVIATLALAGAVAAWWEDGRRGGKPKAEGKTAESSTGGDDPAEGRD